MGFKLPTESSIFFLLSEETEKGFTEYRDIQTNPGLNGFRTISMLFKIAAFFIATARCRASRNILLTVHIIMGKISAGITKVKDIDAFIKLQAYTNSIHLLTTFRNRLFKEMEGNDGKTLK